MMSFVIESTPAVNAESGISSPASMRSISEKSVDVRTPRFWQFSLYMRSMFSAITTRIPAMSSAYGDCSRELPFPRRLPLTEQTKPPFRTRPRATGNSPLARRPR